MTEPNRTQERPTTPLEQVVAQRQLAARKELTAAQKPNCPMSRQRAF